MSGPYKSPGYVQVDTVEQAYEVSRKLKKRGIRSRIADWLREKEDTYDGSIAAVPSQAVMVHHEIDSLDGLNMTLYSANGGYVVNFRRYDRKTDRNHTKLYVITSDQKFEEALAQCIAMECLSR